MIKLRLALLSGPCGMLQVAGNASSGVLLQAYERLLSSRGSLDEPLRSARLRLFKEKLTSLYMYRNDLADLSSLEWSSGDAMDQLAEYLFGVHRAFYLISNFSELDDFNIGALHKIAPLYASLCRFFISEEGSNISFEELSNADYGDMARGVGGLVGCLGS